MAASSGKVTLTVDELKIAGEHWLHAHRSEEPEKLTPDLLVNWVLSVGIVLMREENRKRKLTVAG
jgi:hypothetical protein